MTKMMYVVGVRDEDGSAWYTGTPEGLLAGWTYQEAGDRATKMSHRQAVAIAENLKKPGERRTWVATAPATPSLFRRACRFCRELVYDCKNELEWERHFDCRKDGTIWAQTEYGCEQMAEVTLTGAVLRTLFQLAVGYAGDLRCRLRGHDWEDDSYGGPDSGCMAGHCRRCGYSFHHTLY